ncbi:MFS transporter [Gynuella sp.]|uniref:MFS transporter n=1 Tax=Gynuella sp. TaxID=2969146 RepID=UPI003D136257
MANRSVSTRIYEKLVRHPVTRKAADMAPEAQARIPRNFVTLLISQFLVQLGDAVSNPKIILPWIMGSVGAPLYQLGFLVPIREAGSLLPQLLIAEWISRYRLRKWFWVFGSLFQSLAIAGIGLVAWHASGALAGWLIIALLSVFSLARGLSSTASKDVLGKTIPKSQRGEVNGWSASFSGLITLIMGTMLLLHNGHPLEASSYGYLILMASLLWTAAAAVFIGIRELPGEIHKPHNVMQSLLQRSRILITDRPFRRFVVARALLLCSALTAPYYVALAQQLLGNPLQLLGMFVLASGAASLVSGPVWGKLADISSTTVMAVGSFIAAGLGFLVCLLVWLRPEWLALPWLLPVCYFFLSIAHQGVRIGRKTYVVDIAEGNLRTDYVAVSNTVIGAVLLVVGGLGALAGLISLYSIILLLSTAGLIGAIMASYLRK